MEWYFERAVDVVVGSYPGDLARLSEHVRRRFPAAPDALAADPELEQRRLLDAMASWLEDLAREQPVVLVLDDLHWATRPTLLMLRHLLRRDEDVALLVIGTYRDTDLDRRHPLSSMLADLRRGSEVERLSLAGLDEAAVLEWLVKASDQHDEQTRELAGALVTETEGNPFFIGEVLRHLVESGAIVRTDGRWSSDHAVADLGIPEGIREVVGQRLDRLSDSVNEILTIAAIVGREFTGTLLEAVSGRPVDDLLALLDEALRARIVEEIGVDRFQFSHALVRATLRDEIGVSRRLRLHRRVAEVIEETDPGNDSALAHHWLEAASSGDPPRAIGHAIAAAERAVGIGAYDDALRLYDSALELAEDRGLEESHRELLLHLAWAQLLAGTPHARASLVGAVDAALLADDGDRLVRGASMLGRFFVLSLDDRLAGVVLDALGRARNDRPRERAELLMAAAGLVLHLPLERRCELVEEALEIAPRPR